MLHTILWDWNGTLIDDVEVALAAMNEMLARRGLPLLQGREPYRDIFTFPVRCVLHRRRAGLVRRALRIPGRGVDRPLPPLLPPLRPVPRGPGGCSWRWGRWAWSRPSSPPPTSRRWTARWRSRPGRLFPGPAGHLGHLRRKQSGPGPALSEKPGRPAGAGPICRGHPPRLGRCAQEAGCPCVLLAQGIKVAPSWKPPASPCWRALSRCRRFCEACKLNPPAGNRKDAPPQKPRVPYQPTGCRVLRRLFFMLSQDVSINIKLNFGTAAPFCYAKINLIYIKLSY